MSYKKPNFINLILNVERIDNELTITLDVKKEVKYIVLQGVTDSITYMNDRKYKNALFTTKRFDFAQVDLKKSADKRINELNANLFDVLLDSCYGIIAIQFLNKNKECFEEFSSHKILMDKSENIGQYTFELNDDESITIMERKI